MVALGVGILWLCSWQPDELQQRHKKRLYHTDVSSTTSVYLLGSSFVVSCYICWIEREVKVRSVPCSKSLFFPSNQNGMQSDAKREFSRVAPWLFTWFTKSKIVIAIQIEVGNLKAYGDTGSDIWWWRWVPQAATKHSIWFNSTTLSTQPAVFLQSCLQMSGFMPISACN